MISIARNNNNFNISSEVETNSEPNHCTSCSTGKDASSCVVHLTNDGVVVNGYDVSIQFLGSRSVHSYLCKMDDGSFYACKNIAISKYMSIII